MTGNFCLDGETQEHRLKAMLLECAAKRSVEVCWNWRSASEGGPYKRNEPRRNPRAPFGGMAFPGGAQEHSQEWLCHGVVEGFGETQEHRLKPMLPGGERD